LREIVAAANAAATMRRSAFLQGVQPTPVVCVYDLAIGVAPDKAGARPERHQLIDGFTGQRACRHIAADHDRLDALARNVGQYGLERRQVAVNVVQSGPRTSSFSFGQGRLADQHHGGSDRE
jgi:hypothetical protein